MPRDHVKIFLFSACPPYICTYCSNPIERHSDLAVHHANENHDDNDVENLEPMHRGCHQNFHMKGKPRPDTSEMNRELWQRPHYREFHANKVKDQWAEGGSLRLAQQRGAFSQKNDAT